VQALAEQASQDARAYERHAALLELEAVHARRGVVDVDRVLEDNRALRRQIATLAADQRIAAATEADRVDDARRDLARHTNALEAELRRRWRASEGALRREAEEALGEEVCPKP
jgi:hypothetical protein